MALHEDDPDATRPEGNATLDVSRRAFLKTVSASSVAAGVLHPAGAAAQGAPAALGPGEVTVRLSIDGQSHTLKVEPRVTLLDAMRERLNLTAQKRVCDRGSCGACTVLVDGRTARSCLLLAAQLEGAEVTTVEGLTPAGGLSVLQGAFRECHALQCGFCTAGMLATAHELLAENPAPTRQDIRDAIAGNLCMCTGYVNIVRAIELAARRLRESTAERP